MMTITEFERALDRWSGDLKQWPEEQAGRARALLAANEDARRKLEAARALDEFLVGLRRHEAPARLPSRIVARLAQRPSAPDVMEQALGWFTARLWRPALLALVVTAAGYLAGMALTQPELDPALADETMTLAFSDIYAELEDAQQ